VIGGTTLSFDDLPEIPESRRTALLVIKEGSGREVIATALKAEDFSVSSRTSKGNSERSRNIAIASRVLPATMVPSVF
jgi:hypothetical protein